MFGHEGLTVSWLGHATLRIEGRNNVVYTDPGRYDVLDGYLFSRRASRRFRRA
jgi:L-ascorbate metabolism protein UlaG (beta-lactamase superfamily)